MKKISNPVSWLSESSPITTTLKVLVLWTFFGLVLVGLHFLRLPSIGSAAAPVTAAIAIAATLILVGLLLRSDKRSMREIGLSNTVRRGLIQFLWGVGLGVVVVGVMTFALLLLTPLEIASVDGKNILAILGVSFVVLLVLALMEEIVFRSYALFRLKEAWGIRVAIYVTAIVFAFYHGLALENLLGPGVWGLFFGYMAISTGNIALPTGFHLGLNWLQALLGMKPQYSAAIWGLSVGSGEARFAIGEIGIFMQCVLFVIGIVLVERLARQQNEEH